MMANFSKNKTFEQLEAKLQKLRGEWTERAKKAEGQFNDLKTRIQKLDVHLQPDNVKAQVQKLKGLREELLKGSDRLRGESEKLKAQALKGISQLGTQLKNLAEEERKKRRGGSGSQGT